MKVRKLALFYDSEGKREKSTKKAAVTAALHLFYILLIFQSFVFFVFRLVRYGGSRRKWNRNLRNVGMCLTVRGYRSI
ncbi:hypothetical protein [Bacillus salipaludis]|uniref:Uncharacterized protein n=1 Tax=Bacillus salipaludis TaxID=2547811 RepID=A0AA90TX88_9BACI|nr:hypothetical protein [Bacillus salipaludis]MDQ6601002.1 hypothetical protein [Bacillus salipaludis]